MGFKKLPVSEVTQALAWNTQQEVETVSYIFNRKFKKLYRPAFTWSLEWAGQREGRLR